MNKYLLLILLSGQMACSTLSELTSKPMQSKTFKIQKRWVTSTLDKDHYGFRHPHRMKPLIYDDLIIQGNGIDGIGAFNRDTGRRMWFTSIKGGVEGGAERVGPYLFLGGSDGLFYSLDANNGKINWTFPVKAETLGAPTVHNGTVYFLSGNNRIFALNAEDGKQMWTHSRRESSNLTIRGGSKPAVDGNRVFVGFSDGYLMAFDAKSGNTLWEKRLNRNRRFMDIDSSPLIEGDRLYITSFDDGLYCLDKSSGKEYWRVSEGGFSKPQIQGGDLFYSTSNGFLVSLDKKSGKQKWKYKLKKGSATEPAYYRGLLAFGEYEGDFRVVNAETGKEMGHFSPGKGILGPPQIDGKTGEVYFISESANLYALKLGWIKNVERWPWD